MFSERLPVVTKNEKKETREFRIARSARLNPRVSSKRMNFS
jgi:hypothetical protein